LPVGVFHCKLPADLYISVQRERLDCSCVLPILHCAIYRTATMCMHPTSIIVRRKNAVGWFPPVFDVCW